MKKNIKYLIYRIIGLGIVLFALVTSMSCKAQESKVYKPKLLPPVKAGNQVYVRHQLSSVDAISYCNDKYNEDQLVKNYPPLNPLSDERFSVNIKSNDLFIKAIKDSFTPERFKLIQNNEEKWHINFIVSQRGELLSIAFVLEDNSLASPDDLVVLESNFQKYLTFDTYRNSVKGNAHKSIHIFFNFSDIEKGKVEDILVWEQAYQRYLQGEAF